MATVHIDRLLETCIRVGASDIHLISGHPPMARIHTVMTAMDYPVVTPESAMEMVDIPEIVRTETLERGAQYLHYLSIEDTENSDYLFDIIIRRYGIDAKSWTASVYFKMNIKITLLDNRKGKEVWRRCFHEKVPVSREVFGLPDAAGNVITAISLSQLTAEQIAIGLENLALHTSDRMIHKLQRDFSEKNQ